MTASRAHGALVLLVALACLQVSAEVARATSRPGVNVPIQVLVTSPVDDGLRAVLDHVVEYFERASFGYLRLRFSLTGCQIAVVHPGELESAIVSLEARRQFVRRLLAPLAPECTTDAARMLIFTGLQVWPFTVFGSGTASVELRTIAVVPTGTEWGIVAHEVGHLLGLRDLYDQRHADEGLAAATPFGPWCLMSRSRERPGPCAWSRLQLGWLAESDVVEVHRGSTAMVTLDSMSVPLGHTLVVKAPVGSNRFYLIEARSRTGIDACLPTGGVLITRIDYFAREPSEQARLVDAKPETATLDDATFGVAPHVSRFRNPVDGIDVAVENRLGTTYSVLVSNADLSKR